MSKKLGIILLIGTLLLAITACKNSADTEDTAPETFIFRDTVWGMTIDEVKEVEGEPHFENFSDLVYYDYRYKDLTRLNDDIDGFFKHIPIRVIYTFSTPEGNDRADLRLAYAHYQVTYEPHFTALEKPTNGINAPSVEIVERMTEDYLNLKTELTEKYGEPDRTENEAPDKEALRRGDLILSSSWTKGDTALFLQISATSLLTISIYDVTKLDGNIEIMLSSVQNPPVLNPALDFPQHINQKYRLG